MSRHSGVRLLAALALACACVDDPAPAETSDMCAGDPATVMAGELIEWFPFGHDFKNFCSAGFDIAEDHTRWVAEAWGTEPREFQYGLFESRDEPCWPCSSSAGACAPFGARAVATTELVDRHEIAHAVRAAPCFPLVEEGWAMLYGGHFVGAGTEGDIRVALEETGSTLPGIHYPIAARFVAFLLETRGVAKLRELCDADGREPADFEKAVFDTYGITFEELATEFDAYPEWTVGELRQDQACESNDVIVGPTSWDFAFECGAPGIEGKLGAEFETQRLIAIPEGMYKFNFESPIDLELRVEIRSCTREGMASIFYYSTPEYVQAGTPYGLLWPDPYPTGVYVVRVRVVEPTGPVNLHMSVAPWP